MKVAVSSVGTTLDSMVDPRFGRCQYFLFVETDTMAFEAYPNDNAELQRGAGIQAAQFVVEKGAKAVLTGRCGPNASLALSSSNINYYEGVGNLSVKGAVEKFLRQELTAAGADTVMPTDNGMPANYAGGGSGMGGGGRGMGGGGRGMGGGRCGMGGGRGMGGGGRCRGGGMGRGTGGGGPV